MSIIFCEICGKHIDTDYLEIECDNNEQGELEHGEL